MENGKFSPDIEVKRDMTIWNWNKTLYHFFFKLGAKKKQFNFCLMACVANKKLLKGRCLICCQHVSQFNLLRGRKHAWQDSQASTMWTPHPHRIYLCHGYIFYHLWISNYLRLSLPWTYLQYFSASFLSIQYSVSKL